MFTIFRRRHQLNQEPAHAKRHSAGQARVPFQFTPPEIARVAMEENLNMARENFALQRQLMADMKTLVEGQQKLAETLLFPQLDV